MNTDTQNTHTYTPEQLQTIEDRCRATLRNAQSKGYTIVDDVVRLENLKCCCIVGALNLNNTQETYLSAAVELGITLSQLNGIEMGFMGSTNLNSPWVEIGHRLRKEFEPNSFHRLMGHMS